MVCEINILWKYTGRPINLRVSTMCAVTNRSVVDLSGTLPVIHINNNLDEKTAVLIRTIVSTSAPNNEIELVYYGYDCWPIDNSFTIVSLTINKNDVNTRNVNHLPIKSFEKLKKLKIISTITNLNDVCELFATELFKDTKLALCTRKIPRQVSSHSSSHSQLGTFNSQ